MFLFKNKNSDGGLMMQLPIIASGLVSLIDATAHQPR